MRSKSFRKGIHPPDRKGASNALSTEVFPPVERVVIPLHQHTGAPAEPLVKKGDNVARGQKIGEARGLISACIHASISGTVKAVDPMLSPSGKSVLSIQIDSDGEDTLHESVCPLKEDLSSYTPDEVRQVIREAGIVGLGGAAFPTAVKLTPPREYPVDTVILNGAECEPFLTTDHRVMLERADDLIAGADILRTTVGAAKVVLGVETNKMDVITLYESKLRGRLDFTVVPSRTKYPQGGEKMLIKAILGREVPRGGLPFHCGVLVQNVGTTVAVLDALKTGMPLIERGLTVSGDAVTTPKNLQVRIGTSFHDILTHCGGSMEEIGSLIMGGPMMGVSQWTDEIPVVKATSGILAFRRPGAGPEKEYPCIRCNSCATHCPMNLIPTRIVTFAKHGRIDEAQKWGLMDCMECGTCAYACPARIPLVQWVRVGKYDVFQSRKRAEARS